MMSEAAPVTPGYESVTIIMENGFKLAKRAEGEFHYDRARPLTERVLLGNVALRPQLGDDLTRRCLNYHHRTCARIDRVFLNIKAQRTQKQFCKTTLYSPCLCVSIHCK